MRVAMHGAQQHEHGGGTRLDPAARTTLGRGLEALLETTGGLMFESRTSERYPYPLATAVYGHVPEPAQVREAVASRTESDPVGALEDALVLLELYAQSRPGVRDRLPDDNAFLGLAFGSKRLNGWIGVLGDGDRASLEGAINSRWRFRFMEGEGPATEAYVLLNLLARYGFVYGRIPPGDSHALGHFIEDYTPGLVVCHGHLDDLELAVSLASMKLGVPAAVPGDYPFPLGRQVRVDSVEEVETALPAFPNIRRMLDLPELPRLPEYLSPEHAREQVVPVEIWGNTPESFYVLRKGPVQSCGTRVQGEPSGPMGVALTCEAEPLDAFDRQHVEQRAAASLSMMRGVSARCVDGRLVLDLGTRAELDGARLGEALIAGVRHEFPKIQKVCVEIVFGHEALRAAAGEVQVSLAEREAEIAGATEESVESFVTCVGCSPFAPDHVCILTPERPPQCGRAYGQIKAGALYGLDDMSSIHHRALHSGMNSFGVCLKREAIDAVAGEWAGVNEVMWRLTGGRTRRLQLHALGEAPHTGCGCFRLIMFETDRPREGVAVMGRAFKGECPDGRTWQDLHYALGGKQTPGMAGGPPAYLDSPKFLAGHGGWKAVVWVSPDVAEMMGDRLPDGVAVG